MPSFEMMGDYYEPYYDKSLPSHRAQNKVSQNITIIKNYKL